MIPPIASHPEFYEGQDLEALADLPHYNRWILRSFTPYLRGKVLEIGAGIGNFSAHYVHAVDLAVLLEPARNLYTSLAGRFAHLRHVLPVCDLLESWSQAPQRKNGEPFDAAILVNVLEHVEDDRGMIRCLTELLRPGGTLMIFVPALRWLYGSLDTVVHHFRRYSLSGMARLIARAGLELVHLRYFDLLGVLPWFVTGRVLRQRRFNSTAAKIYDRLVVPLASRLERGLRFPIGKNLVCVARKPEQIWLPSSEPALAA